MVVRIDSYRYVCSYILNWSWVILSSSITSFSYKGNRKCLKQRPFRHFNLAYSNFMLLWCMQKLNTRMKCGFSEITLEIHICTKTQPLNTLAEKLTLLISKVTMKKNTILNWLTFLYTLWPMKMKLKLKRIVQQCVVRVVITVCLQHTKNTEMRFLYSSKWLNPNHKTIFYSHLFE